MPSELKTFEIEMKLAIEKIEDFEKSYSTFKQNLISQVLAHDYELLINLTETELTKLFLEMFIITLDTRKLLILLIMN